MRKMVMGTLLAAAASALLFGSGLSAQATKETGEEIRIFVLDKGGTPVDIKGWTGAIDVTPEHGSRKAFKLEPATPGLKEGARELKDEAKEKFGGAKGEGQDRAKTEPRTMEHKEAMLCGQVKKLDDWWVEMVVIPPGHGKKLDEGKRGEGTPGARTDEKGAAKGFAHDHSGPYFKATPDEAAIKDTKTGVVNFKATVVFTMPNGDTKYVKGFEYPEGLIDDSLGRFVDKEFKDTSKLDHEQAAGLAHRVQMALHSLPALSFKSDGDRQEYEKAKQDCMAACQRLEQATGKDIADAADKCKSTLKEVRSQAKDAQGALTAD